MLLWPVLVATALGQATGVDRPVIPSSGVAAESGPGTLWVNPANLAYDPDRRFALYFGQELTGPGVTTFAGTWGMGLVQVGAYTRLHDEEADWSFDVAAAIPLPRRLALGVRLDWHVLQTGTNYVGWDVGASWRPLPWFGLSGVTRNIGNPSEEAVAQSGLGLAVRPVGDGLILGVDYLRAFPPPDTDPPAWLPREVVEFTARVRPVEGLYFRANFDTELTAGLGVEMYFGGYGGGVHGVRTSASDWGMVAWLGTDEPGESLARSTRRVGSLDLGALPPYQPEAKLFRQPDPGWLDVLELLRRMTEDRSVKGLALTLGSGGGSWARLGELRTRILELRAAGKEVVVYLYGDPSPATYYAASAASRVLLHPAARVDLTGPSTELVYFRGALDLLGVEAQVARRSEYKTFAEPFTDEEPSPAQIEQWQTLVDDVHELLVQAVADGRGVEEATAREWIEQGPWTGFQAEEMGIVDARAYPDQLDGVLVDLFGFEPIVTELEKTPQPRSPWEAPKKIAVIHIEDSLVRGESSGNGPFEVPATGSQTIVDLLEDAREDPQVKAVVIRVDSPGGSAFAADQIWRAVWQVRKAGKPVVVSFGGTATSGGYYVAAGADAILAEPTTVTGSIGAIVTGVSVAPALERLGITTTTITNSRHPDLGSPMTEWDPGDREKVQDQVDATYTMFVERVAKGRSMTVEEVEAIARGRVWSGKRAQEVGLVDRLGGFEEAVAEARRLAGIPESRKVALVTYTRSGLRIEALSPTLVAQPGGVTAMLRRPSPQLELPPSLDALWQPLGTWMRLSGEGLLLVDPQAMGMDE